MSTLAEPYFTTANAAVVGGEEQTPHSVAARWVALVVGYFSHHLAGTLSFWAVIFPRLLGLTGRFVATYHFIGSEGIYIYPLAASPLLSAGAALQQSAHAANFLASNLFEAVHYQLHL